VPGVGAGTVTLMAVANGTGPVIQLPLFEFEGPLELLLNLVERRRLPIAELSLATVADQYLSYVRGMELVSQESLSDFLVMAARLILIKSRALLPSLNLDADGPVESVEDLVTRLEAYRTFKLLAAALGSRDVDGLSAFARGVLDGTELILPPSELAPIDPGALASLMHEVETRGWDPPDPTPAAVPIVSVADRVAYLRGALSEGRDVPWDEVAGDTVSCIVATFLAVLEMVRRSEIRVHQPTLFGPIRLRLLDHESDAPGDGALSSQPELSQ
jgi:segregation and condensation protein A